MTNHHKLLFLQNSDIPNHLSTDVRGGAQVTPRSCLKLADLETYPASSSVSKRKHELFKPGKLQFEPLINTVKHLRISLAIEISTDCPSLVSQSLLTDFPWHRRRYQISWHIFRWISMSDFSTDFDDGFPARAVAIHCIGGLTCKEAVIGCASPNIHDE